MGAPTPYGSGTLPELFTGSYLTRTPGTGNLYVGAYTAAEGGSTVFDTLVNPPATGAAAEQNSLTWAKGLGTTALTSPQNGKPFWTAQMVTNMVKKQFDTMTNFYLEASIVRNSSGVPVQ